MYKSLILMVTVAIFGLVAYGKPCDDDSLKRCEEFCGKTKDVYKFVGCGRITLAYSCSGTLLPDSKQVGDKCEGEIEKECKNFDNQSLKVSKKVACNCFKGKAYVPRCNIRVE